jgi:hypothetical protein
MILITAGSNVHCNCEEKEIKHIRAAVKNFLGILSVIISDKYIWKDS